jgi:enoyl-CoA hydratase/carnithine racemase
VSDTKAVTYSRKDFVGYITLNKPEKRNALSLSVWRAIGDAVTEAESDPEARVVVLRGEGKSFCAGLDLSPDNELIPMIMNQPTATQKIQFYNEVKSLQEIHNRLERLRVPTIAAIHGHCLGAGLELVCCCDFRLCSADAIFSLPEASLAIITDVGGLQRLPKIVGPGHAREISFRAHRFGAEKAIAINLVNEVFEDKSQLDLAVEKIAGEIAANPPLAVQGAKEVFLYNEECSITEALDYTAARSAMIMPSNDLMEAMNAYLQKRKGNFTGS